MEPYKAPEQPAAALLAYPTLAPREFKRLSAFIEHHCGIRMPPAKVALLESRLRSRLNVLGMKSFSEYCDYVFGGGADDELTRMVDRITTNKTDFFREAAHFDVLTQQVLPELAEREGAGTRRKLRVWSAGCSTGEEPYTLAMILAEVAERTEGYRFEILATDLSTRVLQHALQALYRTTQVDPVPLLLRKKYLLRSTADPEVVRVRRNLRETVTFRQLNLLDEHYGMQPPMDVIFCRNVFIYFERTTQSQILSRFAAALAPGGYLFLGHSETIAGLEVPFDLVAPTVYRRRDLPR